MNNYSKKIPLKDSLFLNPVDKYRLYGRFPFKMIIHILLALFTATEIFTFLDYAYKYSNHEQDLIYNMFVINYDKSLPDYNRYVYYFSVPQVKKFLQYSIKNYYNLQNQSLEIIEYPEDKNIIMSVSYLQENKEIKNFGKIEKKDFYLVNSTSLGPLDEDDMSLNLFINNMTTLKLNYTYFSKNLISSEKEYETFRWNVIQKIDYRSRAHFTLSVKFDRTPYQTKISNGDFFKTFLLIHIIVVFLAALSLLLTWKHIYKIAYITSKINKKKIIDSKLPSTKKKLMIKSENIENQIFEENSNEIILEDHEKLKINIWSIISIIGNLIQLFGGTISLINVSRQTQISQSLVGLGCMFAFINLGKYLAYSKDYSTIFETLKNAAPHMLRFSIGVLPIFLGFLFFGLSAFWKSNRFSSTSNAFVTLFSMFNGDSLKDGFTDLTGFSPFLGQFYFYLYILLFLIIVLNVFISIIQESNLTVEMKNKNHWIYAYLKINTDLSLEHENLDLNIINHKKIHLENNRELVSQVESKNILREILNTNLEELKKKNEIKFGEKEEKSNLIETYFKDFESKLNELENIITDINNLKSSKIQKEFQKILIYKLEELNLA